MVSPLSPLNIGPVQQADVAGSLLSGRQAYQQSQLANQAMQQNQQQLTREQYDQGLQRLTLINRLASQARQLPPDRRQQFVGSINQNVFQAVGIDPAQVASVPLDDSSLDDLIAQTGAAIPENMRTNRVQSSEILENGTTIQLLANGSTRVTDPDGRELTGAERRKAIQEANQYGAQLQADRAGARTDATLDSRIERGGDARFAESLGQGRGKNVADAEARQELAASEAPNLIAQADDSIRLIDELLAHPGRDIATGSTAWVPAVPGTKQADFINRFDQIKGQAFLAAFESLKGGGAITEVEGRAATQAINRLNRATTKGEFDAAAADLKGVLERAKAKAKNKAVGTTKASQDNEPSLDDLLNKYGN